ncbi:hypothetical protein [Streptomyces griseoruber]|uniref:hypothetical protein n=1 Tax=Streptomyces griseoruber TaxID=1943 RepID=UPI000B1FE0D4|nr:hypothetical protein [Streptomyces griseoruber]
MPDTLLDRYQTARTVYRDHRGTCTTCTDASRCPAGQRLFQSFAALQDAYLTRQRSQRP